MLLILAKVANVLNDQTYFSFTLQGILYSFNAKVPSDIQKLASHLNVTIREFNVIYHLIDDIKYELSNNVPIIEQDFEIGKGVVQQEYLISEGKKKVPVAGNKVVNGKFDRNALIKIVRAGDNLISGVAISSLKHKKDEVSEVNQGQECGVRIEGDPVRFEPGDELIFYEKRKVVNKIDWDPGF